MISVQLFHIGVITLLNLMAIGVIHYLRRWLMRVEITRKLAHISSGLLGLLLPRFFPVYEAVWPMITLWICFSGFLYFTYQRKLLTAINGIDRKTVGAYIMPTTLTSLWLFNRLLFQKTGHNEFVFYDLPLLVLTFGDSLAAFIGSKYGRTKIYPHSQKTWVGFVTILFVTFSISVFYLHFISLSPLPSLPFRMKGWCLEVFVLKAFITVPHSSYIGLFSCHNWGAILTL